MRQSIIIRRFVIVLDSFVNLNKRHGDVFCGLEKKSFACDCSTIVHDFVDFSWSTAIITVCTTALFPQNVSLLYTVKFRNSSKVKVFLRFFKCFLSMILNWSLLIFISVFSLLLCFGGDASNYFSFIRCCIEMSVGIELNVMLSVSRVLSSLSFGDFQRV